MGHISISLLKKKRGNRTINFLKGYKNEMSGDNNSASFIVSSELLIEKHMLKTKNKIHDVLKDILQEHGKCKFNYKVLL